MTDTERKAIEKEIQGLTARLKWTHIDAGVKGNYEARIAELREMLRSDG